MNGIKLLSCDDKKTEYKSYFEKFEDTDLELDELGKNVMVNKQIRPIVIFGDDLSNNEDCSDEKKAKKLKNKCFFQL